MGIVLALSQPKNAVIIMFAMFLRGKQRKSMNIMWSEPNAQAADPCEYCMYDYLISNYIYNTSNT